MTTERLVTATEARLRYADKTYAEALDKVNKRIKLASLTTRECIVDIPMKSSYEVKKTLVECGGFDVIMHHDPENNSSELHVRW